MRPIHVTFLLTAALSFSAPITYNSLTSWQAAGPQDPGFIGFETVTGGQYGPTASLPWFALSGFTFTGVGGNIIIYNPMQSFTNLGAGVSLTGPNGSTAYISITLPTAVYGIGFLVGSSDGTSITAVINGNTSSPITIGAPAIPPGPGAFWGVRNDTAITSIALYGATNVRPSIDSVVWGGQATAPPPETPEAATAIMIGSALLLLPALRRRFFNSSSSSPQQFAH